MKTCSRLLSFDSLSRQPRTSIPGDRIPVLASYPSRPSPPTSIIHRPLPSFLPDSTAASFNSSSLSLLMPDLGRSPASTQEPSAPPLRPSPRLARTPRQSLGPLAQLAINIDDMANVTLNDHQSPKTSRKKRPTPQPRPASPTNHRSLTATLARVAHNVQLSSDGTHDMTREIRAYSHLSAPSPGVLIARQNIIRSVTRAINSSRLTKQDKLFKVVAFGSTAFGLDSDTSDLDLCILDPYLPHGPKDNRDLINRSIYSMKTLAGVLRNSGFKNVMPIQHAVVPIVKFKVHELNNTVISCDLNCNHALGTHNSALLNAYHHVAPGIFRPLGMSLKLWAKARGINDPAGAHGPPSVSSYSLILMLVAYLQTVGQLPNLQEPSASRPRLVFALPTRYNQNTKKKVMAVEHDSGFSPEPPLGWTPASGRNDSKLLAELFLGFFRFYSDFEFSSWVISIRKGSAKCERGKAQSPHTSQAESVHRSQARKGQDQEDSTPDVGRRRGSRSTLGATPGRPAYHDWDEPIAVEDPFIRTRNTCKNVGPHTAQRIQRELVRAKLVLESGGGLYELCYGEGHNIEIEKEIEPTTRLPRNATTTPTTSVATGSSTKRRASGVRNALQEAVLRVREAGCVVGTGEKD